MTKDKAEKILEQIKAYEGTEHRAVFNACLKWEEFDSGKGWEAMGFTSFKDFAVKTYGEKKYATLNRRLKTGKVMRSKGYTANQLVEQGITPSGFDKVKKNLLEKPDQESDMLVLAAKKVEDIDGALGNKKTNDSSKIKVDKVALDSLIKESRRLAKKTGEASEISKIDALIEKLS